MLRVFMLQGPVHRPHQRRVALISGRTLAGLSLAVWAAWLTWRAVTVPTAMGIAVFAVEMVAFAAALALTVGLWSGVPDIDAPDGRGGGARVRALLATLDPADLALPDLALSDRAPPDRELHRDDAGEWMAARRGLAVVRGGFGGGDPAPANTRIVSTVVATDGIRRAAMVGAVVAVLLTGAVPLEPPPVPALAALAAGVAGLAIAHLLLTKGALRPGDRLMWSMSTIGAGLGRRASPSSVRWTAAMATIVILNVTVALRGVSDRWTHGLGEMPRDARIAAMLVALALAATSLAALRRLSPPELGQFGATGRLDELSTRRWALAATGVIAIVGLIVGSMPAGVGG